MPAEATEPSRIADPVWFNKDPLGYGPGLAGFGAVAAPLLAGFALTAVIELTGRDHIGVRGGLAMLGFTYSAAVLLVALQSALSATFWQVPPADRLARFPEGRLDPEWLAWIRQQQWRDEREQPRAPRS
ncbi:MAG: hypothetical protein DLM59_15580 [Pseudonocardiales bacterium]|nr:MAG: hypothetical protein DLM59_15580 [Pseudonocardiales bacterium]